MQILDTDFCTPLQIFRQCSAQKKIAYQFFVILRRVFVRRFGFVDLHEAVVLVRRVERCQDVHLVKVRVLRMTGKKNCKQILSSVVCYCKLNNASYSECTFYLTSMQINMSISTATLFYSMHSLREECGSALRPVVSIGLFLFSFMPFSYK